MADHLRGGHPPPATLAVRTDLRQPHSNLLLALEVNQRLHWGPSQLAPRPVPKPRRGSIRQIRARPVLKATAPEKGYRQGSGGCSEVDVDRGPTRVRSARQGPCLRGGTCRIRSAWPASWRRD